jgi:hypothetical protein
VQVARDALIKTAVDAQSQTRTLTAARTSVRPDGCAMAEGFVA